MVMISNYMMTGYDNLFRLNVEINFIFSAHLTEKYDRPGRFVNPILVVIVKLLKNIFLEEYDVFMFSILVRYKEWWSRTAYMNCVRL